MPLNNDGPWDYFFSHKQTETGRAVALICSDLTDCGKKVWLDVNMDDCGVPAMMEGVAQSKNFVIVLSDGYFESTYCCDEAREAMSLGKNVILCHAEGLNVGARAAHDAEAHCASSKMHAWSVAFASRCMVLEWHRVRICI